jgi:hypothetical protein
MLTVEEKARRLAEGYPRTKEEIKKEKASLRSKLWYQNNKERSRKRNKEWREANSEQYKEKVNLSYHRRKNDVVNIKHYLLKHARARAAKKGLEFSLIDDDLILPEICPIMKKPFDKSSRRYAYSIDRKDPNKGYTKDNIWIISQIANSMKWDSTEEERLLFAEWVLTLEKGVTP